MPLGTLGYGRRRECFTQDAQRFRPLALDDRNETTELKASQFDPARRTDRQEPEVRQKVVREDRLVRDEPLVARLALRVAGRERLERFRSLVARVTDRGQEERLQDPRARTVDEVSAGDEDGILGRRARRKLGRTREQRR